MEPEKEITEYYNKNIERHKEDIVEILCKLLGEEYREVITTKVNNLSVVYFVNRKGVNKCLENNSLEDSERKLLEYFLDKMDTVKNLNIDTMSEEEIVKFAKTLDKNNAIDFLLYIIFSAQNVRDLYGDEFLDIQNKINEIIEKLRAECKKLLKTSLDYHVIGTYGDFNENYTFSYTGCSLQQKAEKGRVALPIYQKDFSPDNDYLWALLRFILYTLSKPIELKHESIDLGKKVYEKAIYYLGIILTERLHQKGIYIFDNKNLAKNKEFYEKIKDEEAYQKIQSYFGNLFSKFLIEPNEFIELVGQDNFRKFALWFIYLAPVLNEDTDYEEENNEEIELPELLCIEKDDLDIDIMEVLDDMYLEYLRHQNISLTTIDFKKITKAKKIMDAKKDYERKEIEQDSKYYHLTLLFKYLEKYGNCNIRFYSQDKLCYTLDFKIDESGKLKIVKYIEVYDKPLFNYDKSINQKAKLKETIAEWEFAEENYDLVLSMVLYYSLYHETTISTNRDLKPATTEEVTKLYKMVLPMFNLNLKELIEWVLSSDNGVLNILTHPRKELEEDYSPATLELKMETLKKKIHEVNDVWRKMNSARSEEEHKAAIKEWRALNRKAGR